MKAKTKKYLITDPVKKQRYFRNGEKMIAKIEDVSVTVLFSDGFYTVQSALHNIGNIAGRFIVHDIAKFWDIKEALSYFEKRVKKEVRHRDKMACKGA